MWNKIIRIFLLYSGVLAAVLFIVSIFFTQLFGNTNGSLISIPFNLIFSWIAGYKGVMALTKVDEISKVLGSPFWQGVEIAIVAGFISTLLVYLLTGELIFSQGLAIILASGVGGRRVARGDTGKTSIL